jgi:hypothetical protein
MSNAGPGKYDDACTVARESTKASGVLLVVFEGEKGSGFSVQAPPEIIAAMPNILEEVAAQIRTAAARAPQLD